MSHHNTSDKPYAVQRTDEEWRAAAHARPSTRCCARPAPSAAFTGEYTDTKTQGVYSCRACGTELFRSDTKFESHCGWPSFYAPLAGDTVEYIEDRHVRDEAGRGALRQLRLAPRPRLRGRGLRHPDRPALLHQLDLLCASSPTTSRVARPERPHPVPRPGLLA